MSRGLFGGLKDLTPVVYKVNLLIPFGVCGTEVVMWVRFPPVPQFIINKNIMDTLTLLPDSFGKTYNTRLLFVYDYFWRQKYGFRYSANIGLFSKKMSELLNQYNEVQIACLMGVFFNWMGVDGNDEFENVKVAKAGFSIFWFMKMTNTYEIYLRNVLGVDMDNKEEMYKFLSTFGMKM